MPVILRSLTVNYGTQTILDAVSAKIDVGITALVGTNGSGKSTLLKTVGTLIRPTEGVVEIDGNPLHRGQAATEARRHLGYLDQRSSFPSNYTVLEALAYSSWLQGVPAKLRKQKIAKVAERTNLQGLYSKKLGALSGGMRQRVFIAQAIVHEPSTLLLDEPMTGLDLLQRQDLLDTISEVAKDTTVLFATHGLEELENVNANVLILSGGKIVFHGTTSELKSHSGTQNSLASAVRELSA